MSTPARLDAARATLREHGLLNCAVRSAGIAGEVLLLSGPPLEEELLLESAGLLEAIRATGFRYVALDLRPLDP